MEAFESILDSNPDQWWQTRSVNSHDTFRRTRALLHLMLKGGDKQIVMLTSIAAFLPTSGGSGYQISKPALLRYTDYLNMEYDAVDRW